jgi:murein DD-endopeptidase MepM/ murein hydrolase activator NlpD
VTLARWLPFRDHRAFLVLGAAVLCACSDLPFIGEPPPTPHAAYAHGLKEAGLSETALGQEWLAAASAALQAPSQVTLPIAESGYLPSDHPRAVAFRVNLVRGRRLVLNADLTPAPAAHLFIDVFAIPESPGDSLRHVIAADSGQHSLEFEPRRTGDYIIRVQPELLRGGRYSLTLKAVPALAFPVQGGANKSIRSGFGAPRDGGVREHHGIDIFAPRGTAVLAAARGIVTRVNETPRGGRVVWVRDEERSLSLYYAHLDRQLVESGALVEIGDTLGLVGNTGNARTTPPHLHFGVYRRGEGPLDPRPWVALGNTTPAPVRADTSKLGSWSRAARVTALRAAPDGAVVRSLAAETMLQVLSARTAWYHVRLPDGSVGHVRAADVASAAIPLHTFSMEGETVLSSEPREYAAVIDTLSAATIRVFGRFDRLLYVRADSLFGWIRQ